MSVEAATVDTNDTAQDPTLDEATVGDDVPLDPAAAQYSSYGYTEAQQQLPTTVNTLTTAVEQSVPIDTTSQEYAQYYQQYYAQYYQQQLAATQEPAKQQAPSKVYKAPSSYAFEKRGAWEKLFDETSGHVYYRNVVTLTSQWKPPGEWTGEVSKKHEDAPQKLLMPNVQMEALQKTLLKRPARKQASADEKHKVQTRPEGALEYNVWYHKWFGEHSQSRDNGPALTRCIMERDCGFTKGDLLDPEGKTTFFCSHFARGCCNLGAECSFYHRIPTELDVPKIDNMKDCFGRDRFRSHRDDMGGVGAFDQDCRTLYVGGLSLFENIEEILWNEFGEWGTPEHINVVRRLNIGFVRYHNRLNAEFAKVAMADQLLAGACQINVRWAYEDPNPNSQTQKMMEQRAKMLEAAVKRGFLDEHGEEPGPKRLCTTADSDYTGYYPSTDTQFLSAAAPTAGSGPKTQQEIEQEATRQQMAASFDRFDQILSKVGK